jgi:hypothetical protein
MMSGGAKKVNFNLEQEGPRWRRPGAEEALARFQRLWHSGTSPRTLPLDDERVADLEALVSGEIGSSL